MSDVRVVVLFVSTSEERALTVGIHIMTGMECDGLSIHRVTPPPPFLLQPLVADYSISQRPFTPRCGGCRASLPSRRRGRYSRTPSRPWRTYPPPLRALFLLLRQMVLREAPSRPRRGSWRSRRRRGRGEEGTAAAGMVLRSRARR